MLLIFGTDDPHTPEEGRAVVKRGLEEAGVNLRRSLYEAERDVRRWGRRSPCSSSQAGRRALDRARRARSRRKVSLVLRGTATDGAGNVPSRRTTLRLQRR